MKFHCLVFFLSILLSLSLGSSSVILNEIMPHSNNFLGDEWVELYNPSDEVLNLSGWKIGDQNSNDTITTLIIYNKSFAIIIDSNASNNTGCKALEGIIPNESCFSVPSIGNGLNDENDSIFLYNSSGLVDSFSWEKNIKSLGKSWSKNNSEWLICEPSAGKVNKCSEERGSLILLNFPSKVYNNKTEFYLEIALINFLFGNYDLKIDIKQGNKYLNRVWYNGNWSSKNEWLENFTYNGTNFTLKNIIDSEDFFVGNASLRVKVRNATNTFSSEIFTIEILNGTVPTKKLQLFYPEEVKCNENFSINITVSDFPAGTYDVKLDLLDENEKRIGKVWNGSKWLSTYSYVLSALKVFNDSASVTLNFIIENYEGNVVVRPRLRKSGTSYYEDFDEVILFARCSKDSRIKILEVPEKGKFGSSLRVEFEIYRGDTKKYVVYAYVQDENSRKVSEKVVIPIEEKFSSVRDSVDLELKCLNESGYYEVVLEGLEEKAKKKIYLEKCYEKADKRVEEEKKNYSEGEIEKSITGKNVQEIVKDTTTKVGDILFYFFAFICLIFSIYLIIKKFK